MTRARYPVVIHPTRDVTLQGRADLAYWTSELAAQQLHPQAADGWAQLWITATESRFFEIRFRELTISVIVDSVPPAAADNGVYLVSAFNSVGWFAWVERNLFGAPYSSADISVSHEVP
ncbi:MAG: hypothetical protein JNG90_04365, partial [Planctomycetaceae bacterium]|nr:hypothetical protein [Planctomycetaceae bacterium]